MERHELADALLSHPWLVGLAIFISAHWWFHYAIGFFVTAMNWWAGPLLNVACLTVPHP